MKIDYKVIAASALCSALMVGCSDSNSPAPAVEVIPTPYARLAPLAAQTATISIADPDGTPVVTITGQPNDMVLTATVTAISATSLNLDLGLTNNAGRLLFNPKVVIDETASTVGTALLNGSGNYTNTNADEFVSLGDTAIDTGASTDAANSTTMSITVIDTTDPIILEVSIPTEDSTIYVSAGRGSTGTTLPFIDVSNSKSASSIDLSALAFIRQDQARPRDGVSSVDGKYTYFGHSQLSVVITVDTLTHEVSAIPLSIDGQVAAIPGVDISPDGAYLYATQLDGDHIRQSAPGGGEIIARLIKIDTGTHEEMSRVDLVIPVDENTLPGQSSGSGVPYEPSISVDGTKAVVLIKDSSTAFIVDLATMTVDKLLTVTGSSNIRMAALSPDNKFVYVGDKSSNLWVIDVATGLTTSVTETGFGTTRGVQFVGTQLYVLTNSGDIEVFDFATDDYSVPTANNSFTFTGSTAYNFAFGPYGKYYYICYNGADTIQVDITDNSEVNSINSGNRGHTCVVSAY
ncbi:MAG: hypothetical protein QM500_03430 [Methylococcales bacterium]